MAVWLFSPGTAVSSTNKTDYYDIAEILLKVALNTITLPLTLKHTQPCCGKVHVTNDFTLKHSSIRVINDYLS